MLRQAGMSTLFYEVTAAGVVFVDLDTALAIVTHHLNVRGQGGPDDGG